jgi:hypothetical protein
MFSSRTQLFSEEYNGVLGFGTGFSQFTADDSTVEMLPGQMGNAGEYTWRSSFSLILYWIMTQNHRCIALGRLTKSLNL